MPGSRKQSAVVFLTGGALVVVGIALIYLPAAIITLGLYLVVAAALNEVE